MLGFTPLSTTPISALPSAPAAPTTGVAELPFALSESSLSESSNETGAIIRLASASNTLTFNQQTSLNYNIARSANNSAIFSQQADHNFKFESANNSLTFNQQADHNFKLENISNSVTFNQQADHNFKLESVSNSAAFAQQLVGIFELNVSASNSLDFGQVAQTNVVEVSAENTITFNPFVGLNWELGKSFSQSITFDQVGRRTIVGIVSNSITFTQDASQEYPAETDVTFSNTAVGSSGPAASNSLTFGQTVSINFELGLSPTTTVTFDVPVIGFVEENCDLYEYTPYGNLPSAPTLGVRAELRLTDGITTLDFRNPEFNNNDELETYQIVNRARGGTYNLFASSIWPNETTLRFTVSELTRPLASSIQEFYIHNLGKEVTLIDQENRTWTGILLNVDVPILDTGGFVDECRYSVDFEFIGDPI